MHVLGQFELVDDPDRFVWIRGFENMEARRRGLSGFYGGPFWQAHRAEANETMLEFHKVHLLRPLGPVAEMTGGLSLEDRALEPPGAVPAHTGLVVMDFYRSKPGALGRLTEIFEQRVQPALMAQGHQILGHLVAEMTPNDYPGLPVMQDPDLLVVLAAYRDAEHLEALRAEGKGSAHGELSMLLAAEVETIRLRPTAKSLIRYGGDGLP